MQQDGREKGHLSKYWWLKLIAGLILIVAGIVTLWYPAASYEALTLVFGIVIIISGIVQLTVGIDNPRYYYSRGWAIASGIIDIIIGIIFCAWPSMTAMMIPILLAIWFLYSGIMAISFSGQMGRSGAGGGGWGIFLGIIMIILSLCLFFQPLLAGIATVVIFMGLSFLFGGINYIFQAFTLKRGNDDV